MTYLLLYLVSIISPFLALAEPMCLLATLANPDAWIFIAFIVAAGQTTGFGLLYFFGDVILGWMPKLKRKLDEFDLSRFQRSNFAITSLAGLLGLPPATLLSAAGPVFESRALVFLGVLFTARFIRFLVLAALPATFVEIFNPDFLPLWVQDLF